MAKYRKKPVVIEAEQWFPDKTVDGVKGPFISKSYLNDEPVTAEYGLIQTLEGTFVCSPGDWIITGVKGEKYPCKPDIFSVTYELVSEEE